MRYFIFEHPREASSWTDPELVALMQEDSVEVVEFNQCMLGWTSTDEIGTAPAQEGTRRLTNMQAANVVLSKCCNHEHTLVHPKSKVAKVTQEYPTEFCRAILETLWLQHADCG